MTTENQNSFYKWFATFLRDKGLQFTKSGFKMGEGYGSHTFNSQTGFWEDEQHSAGKPPRWILHIVRRAGGIEAVLPAGAHETVIGSSNTAQGDKAGLAVRILPVLRTSNNEFVNLDEFEINALFVFNGALPAGTSSDAFIFNVDLGRLVRGGELQNYVFAGLMGLRDRAESPASLSRNTRSNLTYGAVMDAVRNLINVRPEGRPLAPIETYDLTSDRELVRLKSDVETAWGTVVPRTVPVVVPDEDDDEDEDEGVTVEVLDFSNLSVPENPDLIGIDPAVYRQINAMLQSGKQHIMLYGPPGTGKTSLARWIGSSLPGGKWTLITGSSDWSSQDIIGGYQPVGQGGVDFVPGILLRNFDAPLIIDELNRCDIDKVIGPLFTVLSGQHTTLPYRTEVADKASPAYVILPAPKAEPAAHEFAPGPGWRLVATINSIDKASLYQMSYALSRRFGWVYVDAPADTRKFIIDYLSKSIAGFAAPSAGEACPLSDLWGAINKVRRIGPAPIIDAIKAIRVLEPGTSFFGPASAAMKQAILDAFDMVLLPMLDGIGYQESQDIADAAISAFSLDEPQKAQIRARLQSVAI